ncbi:MAG: elongation factor Ts [Planctomycetes bacterium]|nr:elongation factor Ts [Planctomycetota bacterium]
MHPDFGERDVEAAKDWLCRRAREPLPDEDLRAGRSLTYRDPDGRLGVRVEVRCETDFVARSEELEDLLRTMAMRIARSPALRWVSRAEVPAEVAEVEERELSAQVLLEQPFASDPRQTIGEALADFQGRVMERVEVVGFARFDARDAGA